MDPTQPTRPGAEKYYVERKLTFLVEHSLLGIFEGELQKTFDVIRVNNLQNNEEIRILREKPMEAKFPSAELLCKDYKKEDLPFIP